MSLTANTLPRLSISAPEPSRATNNGPNGLSTQAKTSKKTGKIVALEQEYATLKACKSAVDVLILRVQSYSFKCGIEGVCINNALCSIATLIGLQS